MIISYEFENGEWKYPVDSGKLLERLVKYIIEDYECDRRVSLSDREKALLRDSTEKMITEMDLADEIGRQYEDRLREDFEDDARDDQKFWQEEDNPYWRDWRDRI